MYLNLMGGIFVDHLELFYLKNKVIEKKNEILYHVGRGRFG